MASIFVEVAVQDTLGATRQCLPCSQLHGEATLLGHCSMQKTREITANQCRVVEIENWTFFTLLSTRQASSTHLDNSYTS